MWKRRTAKAFTLIELLVVVAIISILASILFPVFARARENARRASCMSNLKQISLGVMMYTQDYDERYPICRYHPGMNQTDSSMPGAHYYVAYACADEANGTCVTWQDLIQPYTKSAQIFTCPSQTGHDASTGLNYPSYGYSSAISSERSNRFKGGNTDGYRIPITLSAVQRPSEIFMLVEFNASTAYRAEPDLQSLRARSITPATRAQVIPHLGGANIAYADGHVKWTNATLIKAVPNSADVCDLSSLSDSSAYCNRNWNPYIP